MTILVMGRAGPWGSFERAVGKATCKQLMVFAKAVSGNVGSLA